MVDVSVSVDKKEIEKLLKGEFGRMDLAKALNDAGQIILQSTEIGFMKQIAPDGSKWKDNPEWWKKMKGGAAILTGPTTQSVDKSHWAGAAGYKFKKVNIKRMKNSLVKTVEVGGKKVTINYESTVRTRADLNQYGGRSEIELVHDTRDPLIFNVEIAARPHLGVATAYRRLGAKTDPEHIEAIIGTLVDNSV
jgi:hypothetical protein